MLHPIFDFNNQSTQADSSNIARLKIGSLSFALIALAWFGCCGKPAKPPEPDGSQPTAEIPMDASVRKLFPVQGRPATPLAVGQTLRTGATQRQRRALPDGTLVYVNANTRLRVESERRIRLSRGEIFLEVHRRPDKGAKAPFVVHTPPRTVSALRTKSSIRVDRADVAVTVTQGEVRVSGLRSAVSAGQEWRTSAGLGPALRASHGLDWTRDLMAAAESPLVPASQHAGGVLVAVDPDGQNAELSLRRFHIDVSVDRDVTLEMETGRPTTAAKQRVVFAKGVQKGPKGEVEAQYLMVKYRPQLPAAPRRERKDWVFLFESSGDRSPLLASTQAACRLKRSHRSFAVRRVLPRCDRWAGCPPGRLAGSVLPASAAWRGSGGLAEDTPGQAVASPASPVGRAPPFPEGSSRLVRRRLPTITEWIPRSAMASAACCSKSARMWKVRYPIRNDLTAARSWPAGRLPSFTGDLRLPGTAPCSALCLAGICYFGFTRQYNRAESLLDELLRHAQLGREPLLWRLPAFLPSQRGDVSKALARMEKALDLEYQARPAAIHVEALREDYGNLLAYYLALAQARHTLGEKPGRELATKVIRAADRWRSFDPDPAAACRAAAQMMPALGLEELAWEYDTTPVGHRPDEASAWVELAQTMVLERRYDLADRAYAAGIAAEPSNGKILWERAVLLLRLGRTVQAGQLFRQIAQGDWEENSSWLREGAREFLDRDGHPR